jgi:DNA mismatch endonuclease (patch repair protein)
LAGNDEIQNVGDIFPAKARSHVMSQIRSKNTRPELQVRHFLWNSGFRYRLHGKKLPGSPDIVLPRYKTVVFVHGCFWHGHPNCKQFKMPGTNTAFWEAKIGRNRERDACAIADLKAMGWNVIVLWECEIQGKAGRPRLVRLISEILGHEALG